MVYLSLFSQDIETVWALLASVVHITNLQFLPDDYTDGVCLDKDFEYSLHVGK